MPRLTREQLRDITSVTDARPIPGTVEAQNLEARAAAGREGFGVPSAPGPAQINAAIAPSSGGQVVNNQFVSGGGVSAGTGGSSGDVNTQLARGLLADGNITDAHRQRLQRIVQSKDADARKRTQDLSDFQFKKLVEARTRASNPISRDEFDFGVQQIHQRTLSSLAPNPTQVRKEFEESKNPPVAIANASEALSQRFGLSADSIAPMLGLNKDTKEMDPALYQKAFSMFLEQEDKQFERQQGSARRQSAVKTSLSRMDKELALMRKDPMLFDPKTGVPAPAPSAGGVFSRGASPEQNAAYRGKVEAFNKLVFDRGELAVVQDDFIRRTAAPGLRQPEPLPGGEVSSPLGVAPPPASDVVDFADAGPNQYTQESPYEPKPTDDAAVLAAAARRLAQKRGTPVYVRDPETGRTVEFK